MERLAAINRWLELDDLLDFKDEAGRNKLAIVVNDLKADYWQKKFMVRRVVHLVECALANNPAKIKFFDSEDKNGIRTITYLVSSGMLEESEQFIAMVKRTVGRVGHGYDLGLSCPAPQEEGVAPICLLAYQLKSKERLYSFMDELYSHDHRILSCSIDRAGNSLSNVAILFDNYALLEYICEKDKNNLKMRNFAGADALSTSLQLFRHEITRKILSLGLVNFMRDDKEYGRDLLIYSASFANAEGVKILVGHGADIKGSTAERFLTVAKKVGSVFLESAISFADLSASYGAAYLLGKPLKADLAKTTLDSVKGNFFPLNRYGFRVSEEEKRKAITYVENYLEQSCPIKLQDLQEWKDRIIKKLKEYKIEHQKKYIKYTEEKSYKSAPRELQEEYLDCLHRLGEAVDWFDKFHRRLLGKESSDYRELWSASTLVSTFTEEKAEELHKIFLMVKYGYEEALRVKDLIEGK